MRLRKGFLRAQDLGATPQGGGPGTAVAIDVTGTATVAWTDRCACGEAGMTPAPNPLRVARSNVAGRFTEPAQVLDTGEDVVRLPEVAAGRGVSVVAWGTENGDGGTFAAVAPERSRFGPVNAIGTDGGALAVDGFVPTLVSPTQAWRWQAGTWSAEAVGASGFARAAVRDRDDRLALVTQDGERLQVSYRSA